MDYCALPAAPTRVGRHGGRRRNSRVLRPRMALCGEQIVRFPAIRLIIQSNKVFAREFWPQISQKTRGSRCPETRPELSRINGGGFTENSRAKNVVGRVSL